MRNEAYLRLHVHADDAETYDRFKERPSSLNWDVMEVAYAVALCLLLIIIPVVLIGNFSVYWLALGLTPTVLAFLDELYTAMRLKMVRRKILVPCVIHAEWQKIRGTTHVPADIEYELLQIVAEAYSLAVNDTQRDEVCQRVFDLMRQKVAFYADLAEYVVEAAITVPEYVGEADPSEPEYIVGADPVEFKYKVKPVLQRMGTL